MSPSLEEMSLEELWQLFPIFLREHQAAWKDWYEAERLRLLSFLPEHQIVRLSHIGSTSVETIWAKPIVDILLEIPKETDMVVMRDLLLQNGYLLMSESKGGCHLIKATHRAVLRSGFSICVCAMKAIMMNFTLETIYRSTLL
ncbi:glutamate-rich protein GrpB [Streptococcus sanguinis]|uniref:Glutamate-rich protein GrpB n=1 Tax=Streptococcus sanguinis TaxID=1305 RepID=A0A2X3Y867_STRSA|nr:glutamate-rich protein GrpB [Streptococcus sanguinis]